MEFRERNFSVLLVCSSQKFADSVLPLLAESSKYTVDIASEGESARRILSERSYDLVIINTPLPGEAGVRLAIDITEQGSTGVLLFVKAELYAEISDKVEPFGVLTVSKPTNTAIVRQSLALWCATRERIRRMERKVDTLEEKMEEIRLVNRAKWILISELKMTEAEAHRYIEKTAMDRCVSKRSIAQSIIKTYQ